MLALGIDLGTAFARVAVHGERGGTLIQFPDGAHSVPAVVSASGGQTRVGRAALTRAATHPAETVRAIKRLLGRSADDAVVAHLQSMAAYGVAAQDGARMVLQLGSERHAPEMLAAALVRHLLDVTEQSTGERPSKAVLTAPYWYATRQRDAIKRAAEEAGLSVLQVISEATATALSLLEAEPETRRVAIVDIGAGGCSVSILEMGRKGIRLLSAGGDPVGAGDDVDAGLVRAMLKGLRKRVGDFPDSPAVTEMLRQVCEGAKRDLSDAKQVTAVVPFLPIGSGLYNQQVAIARESVDRLMQDSCLRIGAACRSALHDSGLTKGDLAAVYAAGGMARLPAVRASIADALGEISSRRLDPDGSVALGAAHQAGMLLGLADSIPVIDIQSSATVPPTATGAAASIPPAQFATVPPAAKSERPAAPQVEAESFKVEMAGLLAALRAGALTDGGRAADKRKLVARVHDVIEDDGALTEEALAQAAERLSGIWRQLALTMQTARQYRWDHPQTLRALEHSRQLIEEATTAAPNSVRWDVRSLRFSHRGIEVWKPDRAPYDRIPHELFADGVRKLQIKSGVTTAELVRLLGVLLRDPALGFGTDDDSATALWDSKLEHVAYVAVDAFSDADDPAFDDQRDALAKELSRLASSDGDADAVLSSYATAQRNFEAQLDAVAEVAELKAALAARLQGDDAALGPRFARAFVEAYAKTGKTGGDAELLAAVTRHADEQLSARAPEGALALADELARAFEPQFGELAMAAFHTHATSQIWTAERLANLSAQLTELAPLSPTLAERFVRCIDALGDDRFVDGAVALHPALGDEQVSAALCRYLGRFVAGHEAAVGSLLASAPPEQALQLLSLLRGFGSDAALAAIHSALSSPHMEVRLEAVASMPPDRSEQLRDDVRRILEDPEPAVRLRALEVIIERALVVAGPALVHRARSEEFSALPLREQRFVLEAIAALNRERGEALAIELLERQSLLGGDDQEHSRALAAEFLGQFDSPAALAALQRAAKKRWFGGSDTVREAASQSLSGIEVRRSQPARPRVASGTQPAAPSTPATAKRQR